MRAGHLRHRVAIIAPAGTVADAAVTVDTVAMGIDVLPPSSQALEHLAAGGQQSSTIYVIQCRYRTDMRTSMVLQEQCCTARTFQVVAIVPRDKRAGLDMTCIESRRAA